MKVWAMFLHCLLLCSVLIPVTAATHQEQKAIDLAIVLNQNLAPEELVVLLMEQKPELSEDILASLIETYPNNATTIAQAAILAAPAEQMEALISVAINTKIDPSVIVPVTAAGDSK
ncbi:hypothetical protein ACXJY6_04660 [Vibrio sp. RC27]